MRKVLFGVIMAMATVLVMGAAASAGSYPGCC
jgi:hypothetical protein